MDSSKTCLNDVSKIRTIPYYSFCGTVYPPSDALSSSNGRGVAWGGGELLGGMEGGTRPTTLQLLKAWRCQMGMDLGALGVVCRFEYNHVMSNISTMNMHTWLVSGAFEHVKQ